jgi:hypothetical protein
MIIGNGWIESSWESLRVTCLSMSESVIWWSWDVLSIFSMGYFLYFGQKKSPISVSDQAGGLLRVTSLSG